MNKPLWFRGRTLLEFKNKFKNVKLNSKREGILFAVALVLVPGSLLSLNSNQSQYYAYAYAGGSAGEVIRTVSPLFENQDKLFAASSIADMQSVEVNLEQEKSVGKNPTENKVKENDNKKKEQIQLVIVDSEKVAKPASPIFDNGNNAGKVESTDDSLIKIPSLDDIKQIELEKNKSLQFAQRLYDIVGEAPIKEMVPFISQRDDKVAAFLVGIAKKESSFGFASPSKDGKTCYNYWGYKGTGGRGTGMGYACFASAEEAIKVVGDRIETLVGKERNTPARMVDTWKCGRSCVGDPGAPGWVSTVAMYFNQIVNHNS